MTQQKLFRLNGYARTLPAISKKSAQSQAVLALLDQLVTPKPNTKSVGPTYLIYQPTTPERISTPAQELNNIGTNRLCHSADYGAAARAFQDAVNMEPDLPEAQNSLGIFLLEIGYYQAAIEHVNQAAQAAQDAEDPQRPQYRANLALALMENQEYPAALQQFKGAIQDTGATDPLPIHNLAKFLWSAEPQDFGTKCQVLTLLETATELNPSEYYYWAELAHVRFMLGESQDAQRAEVQAEIALEAQESNCKIRELVCL